MITRRRVVFALGACAFAPLASFAQPRKVWRVGFLWESDQSVYIPFFDAFKAGMSALGYAEGRDYVIEHRSAQADYGRLPAVAAEMVALKVDVIISSGTPSAVAASKATGDIPILITNVGDPISIGLAASLARPGGNVTGLTSLSSELITKRLDLLHQLLPRMRRVALLYDPNNRSDALNLSRFESDCGKLKIQPIRAPARNAGEMAAVFKILARDKAQALIVTGAATNAASLDRIIEHAAKLRLPTAYNNSYMAKSGGLISYGQDVPDRYRRIAVFVDKIFKGAKPGDLPIEQPMRFEFVVNMKTARALGIKIPNSILVQATKVIE